MSALQWLLITLGPWLVVAVPALLAELANPGFLFGTHTGGPRPWRPSPTYPRPARGAVRFA